MQFSPNIILCISSMEEQRFLEVLAVEHLVKELQFNLM